MPAVQAFVKIALTHLAAAELVPEGCELLPVTTARLGMFFGVQRVIGRAPGRDRAFPVPEEVES